MTAHRSPRKVREQRTNEIAECGVIAFCILCLGVIVEAPLLAIVGLVGLVHMVGAVGRLARTRE